MSEHEPIFKPNQINPKAIKGEPGTGYEPRIVGKKDKGDFACFNCHYYTDGLGGRGCDQMDMKTKSKQPRLPDGRVKVDSKGCCEYVERIGVA